MIDTEILNLQTLPALEMENNPVQAPSCQYTCGGSRSCGATCQIEPGGE